jgi:hypothetical protein
MLIKANDIQINYGLTGKQHAPVVVLSHSLACSMVMWDPQLEMLESKFRVGFCALTRADTVAVKHHRGPIPWSNSLMMPLVFLTHWILKGFIGWDYLWAA